LRFSPRFPIEVATGFIAFPEIGNASARRVDFRVVEGFARLELGFGRQRSWSGEGLGRITVMAVAAF
jgi:hypothetical protein